MRADERRPPATAGDGRATDLHVLRVFVGPDGGGGNPLGVVLDGAAVPTERRQAVANALGFSETVFVDDIGAGRIRIFTPAAELAFAGHPTVGTSWLLRTLGRDSGSLRVNAGEVVTWEEDGLAWIRARAAWVHEMQRVRYATPADVDALTGAPAGASGSYYAWAWIDEGAGILRSRYFVPHLGIGEDEATGAAAVVMGDAIGRPLEIRQGRGSVLHVRPGPDGTVEVGGRVEPVEVRPLAVA